MPSPLPPLPHFYAAAAAAAAAQAYPVMSPLAFPTFPCRQPLPSQQHPQPPSINVPSPLPSTINDDSQSAPPVFVFPPIPDGDSRQPAPFNNVVGGVEARQPSPFGSDGNSVSGSSVSGGDSSRGVSPINDITQLQSSQQQQQQHTMTQFQPNLECPTPTLPLMSPLISPFFNSSMTPTFSYDSLGPGMYQQQQHPQSYLMEGSYPQQQQQMQHQQQNDRMQYLRQYGNFMSDLVGGQADGRSMTTTECYQNGVGHCAGCYNDEVAATAVVVGGRSRAESSDDICEVHSNCLTGHGLVTTTGAIY